MKLVVSTAPTRTVTALSFIGAVLAAAVPAVPAAARAQGVDPRCPGGSLQNLAAQDACQKAVDIFAFMTPQLGIGLVGGNATLGTGGSLGGIGRFSIGVRGNGIRGRMPQVENESAVITGARRSDYGISSQIVGLPAIEGALGLFGGIPLGVTNALAVDALMSATYVPEVSSNNVAISLPDGSLKLGYGARLGLLEESFMTPAVSLTYLRRDLPTTSINATSGDDEISVNDISVKTSAWRGVVGKAFGSSAWPSAPDRIRTTRVPPVSCASTRVASAWTAARTTLRRR
jgi:hypothetical protein